MTIKKALKFSLFIHFLAFWLMGGAPIGCSGGKGDGDSAQHEEGKSEQEKQEEIVDRPKPDEPTEIILIEETKEEFALRIEKQRRKEIAECEPFFGGIGVTYSERGIIGEVHKYYPAYDAGLLKGDQIITPLKQIKGEIGTQVKIEFIRDGELYSVVITRGRICTKEVLK